MKKQAAENWAGLASSARVLKYQRVPRRSAAWNQKGKTVTAISPSFFFHFDYSGSVFLPRAGCQCCR